MAGPRKRRTIQQKADSDNDNEQDQMEVGEVIKECLIL